MTAQLKRDDIAGAVICVVKDGKVLYEKGYGYADASRQVPVSPQDTLFRAGSISKLFAATAVMQLVEDGRLDLDQDIESYLDFRIPATYPQPITLRHLLTHTAGFEEVAKDLFSSSASPLEQYVKTHIPARIYAPGTIGAYSNYGAALAGYIVQRISREPVDQYVANHVFNPLAMSHSTFTQPLPSRLARFMSSGYQVASGGPKPFEYISASPAGALSVSGDDIAHFVIAQLQNGRDGDAQVLRPETAREMHSRQYAGAPLLNGMAIGFFEESRNGRHIIGHGGDTVYFHSHLHLILDANVGFFIAANSAGRGGFDYQEAIWNGLLDRYFPEPLPTIPTLATAPVDAPAISGDYILSRRSDTNFLKLVYLLAAAFVTANSDGTLTYPDLRPFSARSSVWREILPSVYQGIGDQRRIAFRRGAAGQLFLLTDTSALSLERVSWYQSRWFLLLNLACMLSILLATLIWWPVGALLRRHYGRQLKLTPRERKLRVLVRLVCTFEVAVILAWLTVISAIAGGPFVPNSHGLWLLELASLCGMLAPARVLCDLAVVGYTRTPDVDQNRRYGDPAGLFGICLAGFHRTPGQFQPELLIRIQCRIRVRGSEGSNLPFSMALTSARMSTSLICPGEVLRVRLAGAAVIEHPPTEQGDHVSGATGLRHLGAEALVGVARYQLLGFANRLPHHRGVEGCGDGRRRRLRLQLQRLAIWPVIGARRTAEIDGIAVKAGFHQDSQTLREGHRARFGALEGGTGQVFPVRSHVNLPS